MDHKSRPPFIVHDIRYLYVGNVVFRAKSADVEVALSIAKKLSSLSDSRMGLLVTNLVDQDASAQNIYVEPADFYQQRALSLSVAEKVIAKNCTVIFGILCKWQDKDSYLYVAVDGSVLKEFIEELYSQNQVEITKYGVLVFAGEGENFFLAETFLGTHNIGFQYTNVTITAPITQ